MTFAEIVTEVNDRLKDAGNDHWGDAEKKRYINQGYRELCRLTHILKKRDYVTITYNTATFSLPETPTSGTDNVSSIIGLQRAVWRLVASPYTETKVNIISTKNMDRYYSPDWRNTTGTYPQYILTDAGDTAKITIYPKIDTAVNAALGLLYIDYSFIPTVMSATTDVPAFGERFHMACVYYAISQCYEGEAQSKQKPSIGDRASMKFWNLVGSARVEVNSGLINNPNIHVVPTII